MNFLITVKYDYCLPFKAVLEIKLFVISQLSNLLMRESTDVSEILKSVIIFKVN